LSSPGYGERQISEDDLRHVDQIIEQENHPERIIDWFGERRLEYSSIARCRLYTMLHTHQCRLFRFFFERFDLGPDCRDEIMSDLFSVALGLGKIEICDYLLSLNFRYVRSHQGPWGNPIFEGYTMMNLKALKKLVSDYPEIATAICPSDDQLYEQYDEVDVRQLIEFAHHCTSVSRESNNPAVFNPTAWIKIANQKRFNQPFRDEFISLLVTYGAELDRRIIEKVQRNWLRYYRTYLALRARADLVLSPPPFPVDDDGIYHPEDQDCYNLAENISLAEIPDTILDLLRDCRFELSHALESLFYSLIQSGRSIKEFLFFFDRMHFVPELTDEVLSSILKHAIGHDRMDIAEFLLYQDFQIIDKHCFFLYMEDLNVHGIQQLLLGHPEKAASLAPTRRSVQECDGAKTARCLIDLASKLNPAGFDPSDLLRGLVQNGTICDAKMADLIKKLCEMGAAVEAQTYDLLEQSHPGQNYAKSHDTLHYYQEYQRFDLKEPEMV
jgi:hypothetical protein